MSPHPLFWRHHTYSVRYHRWHMYAIIWVIQDIISTLYDNLYYLWHHMHYIHSITCITCDNSSSLYDVTFTIWVTSHNDPICFIKHYMFTPPFVYYFISHTFNNEHELILWWKQNKSKNQQTAPPISAEEKDENEGWLTLIINLKAKKRNGYRVPWWVSCRFGRMRKSYWGAEFLKRVYTCIQTSWMTYFMNLSFSSPNLHEVSVSGIGRRGL